MERFFEVLPECPLFKQYQEWQHAEREVNEKYKSFKLEQGIESYLYVPGEETIGIAPTESDTKRFEAQLKKAPYKDGVQVFKQNSPAAKAWRNIVEENGLKILRQPNVCVFFGLLGRSSSSLFMHKGKLYGYIEMNTDFQLPEGCRKIKGSQFYAIIEESEALDGKTS